MILCSLRSPSASVSSGRSTSADSSIRVSDGLVITAEKKCMVMIMVLIQSTVTDRVQGCMDGLTCCRLYSYLATTDYVIDRKSTFTFLLQIHLYSKRVECTVVKIEVLTSALPR